MASGVSGLSNDGEMDVGDAVYAALSTLNELPSASGLQGNKRKLEEAEERLSLNPKCTFTNQHEECSQPTALNEPWASSSQDVPVSEKSSSENVNQSRSRFFSACSNNSYELFDKGPFMLYVEGANLKTKIHPMYIGKLLRANCPDLYANITSISKIDRWSIKIEANNYSSANKLKVHGIWKQTELICYIPGFLLFSQGLVRDVDYCLSDEEILEYIISEQKVIRARRIHKFVNDKRLPTPLVVLTFRGQFPPNEIKILEVLCKVDLYKQRVIQCRVCYRFGHFRCPSPNPKCVRCGGEHSYNNDCQLPISCLNCKGGHFATDLKCPEFIKQSQIKEIMSEKKLSFKEALISVTKSTYASRVAKKSSPILSPSSENIHLAQTPVFNYDNYEATNQAPQVLHKTISVPRPIRSSRPKEVPHFHLIDNVSNNISPNSPIIESPVYCKNISSPEKFTLILNVILNRLNSRSLDANAPAIPPEDIEFFRQYVNQFFNNSVINI